MPTLEITTGIGCKNACDYCPQSAIQKAYEKRSPVRLMTLDTFKACLDRVPPRVDIHFSGMSEPWLNPHCTEMLLYAGEKGHRILVFTTLVGMTLSDVDLLEKMNFKAFWIHLPSSGGHERIETGGDYLRLLRRIGEGTIKVTYRYHGAGVHPDVKNILGGKALFVGSSSRAGNMRRHGWAVPAKKRGRIACSRKLKDSVLLPNGDVLLCCMDYGMAHVLGNLLSSDYASLFQGKEFRKIRAGLKNDTMDILCRCCDMFAYRVLSLEQARSRVQNFLR